MFIVFMANKHDKVFVFACSYNKQTDTFYIRYFILCLSANVRTICRQ